MLMADHEGSSAVHTTRLRGELCTTQQVTSKSRQRKHAVIEGLLAWIWCSMSAPLEAGPWKPTPHPRTSPETCSDTEMRVVGRMTLRGAVQGQDSSLGWGFADCYAV